MRLLSIFGLTLLTVACQPESSLPHREVLAKDLAPLPFFTPAIRTGNLVFLSGQIGVLPGTIELIEGGIEAETRQTLDNITEVLERSGLTRDDVVKCTVFLADIANYQAMNEVYQTYFPSDPPARSTVAGSGLALGATVEIECIAAVRETD